jgi:effector-binding domain-containing protein
VPLNRFFYVFSGLFTLQTQMKKKVILLILILVIITLLFIPFYQQKTILIKSPFLNTYSLLANPAKWEKWRPDLRKAMITDSSKISIKKDTNSFFLNYENQQLGVKYKGNMFEIDETSNGKSASYRYSIIPVADKFLNKTIIIVDDKTNALNYLIGKFWAPSFSDTHIDDFKNYMETDSLHYGFTIFKTGVPDSTLIVMQKEVLERDKFTEAAKILTILKQYIKTNNIKQMQPVIAQFNQNIKDSVQVKVGLFINKEVKSGNGIQFTRMPKGGSLYAAKFKGEFSKRNDAYEALKQYFTDHSHQLVLLPFETYLNNKLPVNDNDSINIQVNFATFPSGTGVAK